MKKTKKASKKTVAKKVTAERVKKADQTIKSAPKLKTFIELHDSRSLTSSERAYDNSIIRNSLNFVEHLNVPTGNVKLAKNPKNDSYENNDINKNIVLKLVKEKKVKKGMILTFPARNDDTKTGNVQKLVSFMTSNILSRFKGLSTDKLFVFYVNK